MTIYPRRRSNRETKNLQEVYWLELFHTKAKRNFGPHTDFSVEIKDPERHLKPRLEMWLTPWEILHHTVNQVFFGNDTLQTIYHFFKKFHIAKKKTNKYPPMMSLSKYWQVKQLAYWDATVHFFRQMSDKRSFSTVFITPTVSWWRQKMQVLNRIKTGISRFQYIDRYKKSNRKVFAVIDAWWDFWQKV